MKITAVPKLMMFDLDGTLADTAPRLHEAVTKALQKVNVPTCTYTDTKKYLGNGVNFLLARSLTKTLEPSPEVFDSDIMKLARIEFDKNYGKPSAAEDKLFPNVLSTLKYLKSKDIKLVVVTNKPHKYVANILQGLGILDLFDDFLGSEIIPEKKPDPTPLFFICKKFNVAVTQAVMVGDSLNDVEAAQNAKMPSIALTYGYNRGLDIRDSKPDYCFDDFEEIEQLISSI